MTAKMAMKHIFIVVMLIITFVAIVLFTPACSNSAHNFGDTNETKGENIMLENAYINADMNIVVNEAYAIAQYQVKPGVRCLLQRVWIVLHIALG